MDGLKIYSQNGKIQGGSALSDIQRNKNSSAPSADGTSFMDSLKDAINKVDDLQKTADIKMQKLATGESTDIVDTKIAAEKADIALRLMTSIRNKMIDAYQEIMKMQV